MEESASRGSIFSQKLDRATFTVYFLGAVVPLLALAFVVQHYVMPELAEKRQAIAMIAMVSSVSLLSLGSFLVLRSVIHRALERTDRDNERLAALLQTSTAMTSSEHGSEIAATAVACALELCNARVAYFLIRGKSDESPLELFASAGENAEALFHKAGAPLVELADFVMSDGKPGYLDKGSVTHGNQQGLGACMALPLSGESQTLGAVVVVHGDRPAGFDSAQIAGMVTLGGLSSVAMRNADLRDTQRNFFSHVTEILVAALDSHLDCKHGHSNRVAEYANRVGRELYLDSGRLQDLHFGSLLHDIGLLRFDQKLQQNPIACEKHTVIGSRMLGRIRLWERVAPIVQSHHEWFDGCGYPEGLSGDAIPLEARIVAVCDAFDAMTSETSHRGAMAFDVAVEEIRNHTGTQFDPTAAEALLKIIERGEISG